MTSVTIAKCSKISTHDSIISIIFYVYSTHLPILPLKYIVIVSFSKLLEFRSSFSVISDRCSAATKNISICLPPPPSHPVTVRQGQNLHARDRVVDHVPRVTASVAILSPNQLVVVR